LFRILESSASSRQLWLGYGKPSLDFSLVYAKSHKAASQSGKERAVMREALLNPR
jgi:hypothetical protein